MMALNDSITVDILNHEETERLVPLLVYLAIIMLTGIPGNILVIVIYRRNAAMSTYRLLITCLAVTDCITCCVVPFIINIAVNQYTFHGNWLCKIALYLRCWPTFVSAFTIIVIDIDRYLMVCKPHGRQITNKMAKIIWAILVFVSALLGCPILVLFGVREIQLHPYNITGTECAILPEYHNTVYHKLFNGELWFLFLGGLSIIVLLYILIARQIIHRAKKCNSETPTSSTLNSKPETSVVGINTNQIRASSTRKENSNMPDVSFESEQTADSSFTVSDNEMDSVNQTVYHGKRCSTRFISKASRMQCKTESKARQSVFIMFLISLFFIISFLPHIIIKLIEGVNVVSVHDMSDDARTAYKFFERSYFINSVVNPFVYCACAPKFRKDAKALILGLIRH